MAMTIAGLKLWLAATQADDNLLIVLSKDAEGNNFSPLAEASFAVYHPESTYSGEIYEGEPVREENDVKCLVLWPVN
jgi:hypothetical protein